MADFNSAIAVILAHEGGLNNVAGDPGGITNYGISLRFLQEHQLDVNDDGEVDARDIRGLTHDQAADIYRRFFWMANGYDHVDDQTLATKIFDICVNAGPKRAHILLQRALNALGCKVDEDGQLGPGTWAAMRGTPPAALTQALVKAQQYFYRNLVAEKPQLAKFLAGWLKRAGWPNSSPATA